MHILSGGAVIMTKNKSKKKIDPLEEQMKWEIAEQLGLADIVRQNGWSSLTAAQSGKIGGIVSHKKREKQK